MNEGWVKFYRKIDQHWLYPKNREFTEYEAWIDLLLQVNHKPKKVRIKNKVLICERGQSLRSITEWGRRWRWSKPKVYRFFKMLQEDNMIKTVSETVTTRLTICNYESYQHRRNEDETQLKQTGNASETEAYPNKNEKNEKNNTRVNGVPIPEDLEGIQEAYEAYCQYMKETFRIWPNTYTTEADFLTLRELKRKGNDPVKVIWQTIQARHRKFYELNNFNRSEQEQAPVLDGGVW